LIELLPTVTNVVYFLTVDIINKAQTALILLSALANQSLVGTSLEGTPGNQFCEVDLFEPLLIKIVRWYLCQKKVSLTSWSEILWREIS